MTNAPVLRCPDWTKGCTITCDCSSVAIGTVLSQEIDGMDMPIAFGGRILKVSERRYSSFEREFLAILFSLKLWNKYITGTECTVITDNLALSYLLSSKKP